MPEIRVDPLTGLKTVVAGDRATRPGAGLTVAPPEAIDPARDPFAAGHEDQTPPEVYALRANRSGPDTPGWTVRVVPNLYPALDPAAPEPPAEAKPDLFTAAPARGAHEVVVNAPDPVVTLGALRVEQVAAAMDIWRSRMRHHREAGAACVHLIVNERREAGASLPHTHAQLYALDFVPAAIAREREHFSAYATRTMGGNLLADYLQEEVRRRERVVAIDDEAVCLAPYGGRVPYQLLLTTRRPRERFEDDGPTGAALLHDALNRLARRFGSPPPLNLWVRTAPAGAGGFARRLHGMPRPAPPPRAGPGAGGELD